MAVSAQIKVGPLGAPPVVDLLPMVAPNVRRVVVDTHVHLPDMFEITFLDEGGVLANNMIDIGTSVKIWGGADDIERRAGPHRGRGHGDRGRHPPQRHLHDDPRLREGAPDAARASHVRVPQHEGLRHRAADGVEVRPGDRATADRLDERRARRTRAVQPDRLGVPQVPRGGERLRLRRRPGLVRVPQAEEHRATRRCSSGCSRCPAVRRR